MKTKFYLVYCSFFFQVEKSSDDLKKYINHKKIHKNEKFMLEFSVLQNSSIHFKICIKDKNLQITVIYCNLL